MSGGATKYNYRCYVQNLISYDDDVKDTNLSLGGWMNDTPHKNTTTNIYDIEPDAANEGQKVRNAWFRTNNIEFSVNDDYSPSGYTFLTAFKVRYQCLPNSMCRLKFLQFIWAFKHGRCFHKGIW